MARQGLSFVLADDTRVVYPAKDGDTELVDVPRDGKTIGEVVMRGNILMREVHFPLSLPALLKILTFVSNSTFMILRLLARLSVAVTSLLAISL